MNLRRKAAIVMVALLMGSGLLATFLSPLTPVAEAGQWCGQSCTNFIAPTPPPTH
ncbi:MAG: hypothetical protein HY870_18315 [Chloroflexi bacterium]|nr:hypothetical protein [Chloroflexota bacterium]